MTDKKPPEGKARAYLYQDRVWVWSTARDLWRAGPGRESGYSAAHYGVAISEWNDVSWDDPPEFVMAPDGLFAESCWVYAIPDREARTWAWDTSCSTRDDAICVAMTGIRDRYDSDCPALYGRHPDHSEVLKLAWKREDQPVPIESIDWAAVHAGELVPPSRVVVPEVDADGDPRSRMGSSGLMIVCRSGKTEFFRRTVYSMSYEAANYTHDGHLISHRAKGGGWEQVTPQRGGDSRERQDPINLDVIAGGGGGGNGINTSGEISGPKAAGSCAERADASSKSPETGKPKGSDTGERPALPPTNDHRTSGDIIGEEGPFPTVPTMDDYIRRQKEAELAYCKTGVHPEWYQDWLATKVWKYQTPEPKP